MGVAMYLLILMIGGLYLVELYTCIFHNLPDYPVAKYREVKQVSASFGTIKFTSGLSNVCIILYTLYGFVYVMLYTEMGVRFIAATIYVLCFISAIILLWLTNRVTEQVALASPKYHALRLLVFNTVINLVAASALLYLNLT